MEAHRKVYHQQRSEVTLLRGARIRTYTVGRLLIQELKTFMSDTRPRIIVIGHGLQQADSDRLSKEFDIIETDSTDQAIEQLLHRSEDPPQQDETAAEGARTRRLQMRIDEIEPSVR